MSYYLMMSYPLVLQRPGGSGEVNTPAPHSLYKVKLCKYYMQYGRCIWGASCRFAHGKKDLRKFGEASKDLAEPSETLEDAFLPSKVCRAGLLVLKYQDCCLYLV